MQPRRNVPTRPTRPGRDSAEVHDAPAKVAVAASGLMGMVSGSSVANVAATGPLTIPMMKQLGCTPSFSAFFGVLARPGAPVTKESGL